MSYSSYKKNRTTSLEDAINQTKEAGTQKKTYEADPLDWYPTTDKAGNAQILLRAMPPLETEENTYYVRWWHHSFQDEATSQWYIEPCLSTLNPSFDEEGAHDPVMDMNKKLIAQAIKETGLDYKDIPDSNSLKKQASRQKRNINYRGNWYIIKDSHKPEANGTLRKWKYGQGMFNEITKAMEPKKIEGAIEDIAPINPFDLIDGSNLLITITTDPTKKVNGKPARNYVYKWMAPAPLGDDKMMEKVWNELNSEDEKGKKIFSLRAYVAPDKFKSYDDLKKRLTKVLGYDPTGQVAKPAPAPQVAPRPQQSAVTEDTIPWDEPKPVVSVVAPKATPDDWFARLESNQQADE